MKKILVFLSCCLLVLPLISFGIFAEDRVREPYSADTGGLRGINVSSYSSIFISLPRSYPSSDFSFSVNGYIFLNGVRTAYDQLYFYTSSTLIVARDSNANISHYICNGNSYLHGWDGYLYFNSPTSLPSTFIDWYNNSQPDSIRSVDSGVSNTLTFGGQVLDFIVSTEGILALLGLSLGLCLIVPFSIRKIKDFVKGY